MKKTTSTYDLEERTAKFAEEIIDLCRKVPKSVLTIPIIDQLIRAATSVGANYCEANGASSKKDFTNKIFICKKEAKESAYWIRMLARVVPELQQQCRKNWKEAHEQVLIFGSIAGKTKK